MADSNTINHNLVMPEVGASKDSWGTKWNQNLVKLDQLLKVGAGTFVSRVGDTMTGALTLPAGNPTAAAHAANKSYVDAQIATRVPNTRKLSGGDGIKTTIGDFSADRTIAVDATVLRTSGDQTIAGAKTFSAALYIERSGSQIVMRGAGGSPVKELSYVTSAGVLGIYDATNNRWDLQIDAAGNLTPRGTMNASSLSGTINTARLPSDVVKTAGNQTIGGNKNFTGIIESYKDSDDPVANVKLGRNTSQYITIHGGSGGNFIGGISTAANQKDLTLGVSIDGGSSYAARFRFRASGELEAGSFKGNGASLSGLNASQLTRGTVSNARMAGDYSWANLDLSGRLYVRGSDGWVIPGVRIDGDTPNIHFRANSGANGIIGVNGSAFHIWGDTARNGSGDNIALQVNLNSAGVFHRGTQLAYATSTVTAGNGMADGGAIGNNPTITLGTPSAITATSGNTVTSTSHTHSLSESAVRTLIADGTAGQVGTYALLEFQGSGILGPNDTQPGSALRWSTADGWPGVAPAGTWRLMGRIETTAGGANNVSLWMRIS